MAWGMACGRCLDAANEIADYFAEGVLRQKEMDGCGRTKGRRLSRGELLVEMSYLS